MILWVFVCGGWLFGASASTNIAVGVVKVSHPSSNHPMLGFGLLLACLRVK